MSSETVHALRMLFLLVFNVYTYLINCWRKVISLCFFMDIGLIVSCFYLGLSMGDYVKE